MNIICIVEGDGEVKALPTLLRRFSTWRESLVFPNIGQPIRVRRDRFLNNADEFRKQILLANLKCQPSGWILILLDADDDCPRTKALEVLRRAEKLAPGARISVVLAKYEYEAWFIAAAPTLKGRRDFVPPAVVPDAESVRGAKQWMSKCLPHGKKYHEVVDQAAFSAVFDLDMAYTNSRSFRKLVSEWDRNVRPSASN